MMSATRWMGIGAILAAFAIILGAFGAHGLRARLDPYSLDVYEKAAFYHLIHALAIVVIAAGATRTGVSNTAVNITLILFVIGILIFSGSLYVLAVSGIRELGRVTPIGGLAFIVAWLWIGVALLRVRLEPPL